MAPSPVVHPFLYLAAPLAEDPSFVERRMFGCLAIYYAGKMQLVLAAQNEAPWMGVLIPTERKFHASLMKEFPALAPHPILGKWLYVAEATTEFEPTIMRVIRRIAERDERFGILPNLRRKKRKKKAAVARRDKTRMRKG